ncbi:hypothetical protein FRX31_019592 [Thalictrum thalictroides]|uniref:Uncharacterized protein n=1 Tax=Thalictrum thalictroides TaxID=46969 RepID=A0A7J6W0Y3_THATH|nr:hypothetical protein FRX31_019592 [Thalictrum thalictroides]
MVEIEEPSVEKTLTVEGDTNNPGDESLPPKVDDGEEQTNKEEVGDSQEDKEDAAETEEDEQDDDRDDLEDESEGHTKTMKKKSTKPRKYSITVRCSINKVSQHFIVGIKEKEKTSFQKSIRDEYKCVVTTQHMLNKVCKKILPILGVFLMHNNICIWLSRHTTTTESKIPGVPTLEKGSINYDNSTSKYVGTSSNAILPEKKQNDPHDQ